jgi:lipopolysaccharide/colanic/teichoic acid biosynthesis glycosyltransferase
LGRQSSVISLGGAGSGCGCRLARLPRVEDAIATIVSDADAAFDRAALWPAHEWDGWEEPLPLKNLYLGAAGVIWALDALRRRGHAETSLDLAAAALRTLELKRAAPDFAADEHYHPAALLCGETGPLLVAFRLTSDTALADDLHALVRENVANPTDDISWGAPGTLLAALAIWLESGLRGPILYRQERVGLNGRAFKLVKFRSMHTDAEKDGLAVWAASNDPRVTRVGAFIRKTRIDELPQVLNVLRGDMSFVGPRPERPQFVEEFEEKLPYYAYRHQVKPGLTGWAQLCYPYGASLEDGQEKLQYDLYYLKNHSILLDMIILVQTVEVVLLGEGAR